MAILKKIINLQAKVEKFGLLQPLKKMIKKLDSNELNLLDANIILFYIFCVIRRKIFDRNMSYNFNLIIR